MTTDELESAVESTVGIADVARSVWDVLVIGAGPAGAIAAREIARLGARVLLVDKAKFPRSKVCGCCLNGAAMGALAEIGLGDLPVALGAKPLRRWQICSPAGHAVCRLSAGYSISREVLDTALVQHAIAADAHLLDQTQALVANQTRSHVSVSLNRGGRSAMVQARTVIAADGLSGQSVAACPQFAVRVHPAALYGANCILDRDTAWYDDGTIVMACGLGGYVGLVRLEDGRLDVAAALDRSALRAACGPSRLASRILASANLPVPSGLVAAAWRGTPALTRQRATLAANRVFLVGDAAGYTEPFTGQGMAWAMRGAVALSSIAGQAITEWTPRIARQWNQTHHRLIGWPQDCSCLLAWLLRSTRRVDWLISALRHAPWLAAPMIRAVNG